MRFFAFLPLLLCFSPGSVAAEPDEPTGQDLYNLYCIACHGPDGKGAAGAPFPPLEKSDWVQGKPDRMIAVILHGLHQPIFVSGKPYNLEMAPQGAVLNDEQIAKICTYVRSHWGNKEKPVTTEQVTKVREAHKDRTAKWTSPEILGLYPLPPSQWGIKEVSVQVYEGQWDQLPDFSTLNPISEEIEKGPISLRHVGDRDRDFAVVWEGKVESPGDFDNNFWLSSVGGARLIFNDQLVLEINEQGDEFRHTSARTKGHKGWNTLRLEYFQRGTKGGIALSRSGGSMGEHPLTDTARDATANQYPDILLQPENGKSALYRNTIKGVSSRAMGVGLAGGINYAFSASSFALEMVWTGNFMNAGRHWTVRGTGAEPPAGERVVALSKGAAIARLSSPHSSWPRDFQPELSARFLGYDLDETNRPTFRYQVSGLTFEDTPRQGKSSSPSLERHLVVTVPEEISTENLYLRLIQEQDIVSKEPGHYLIDEELALRVRGPSFVQTQGKALLLSLNLSPGQHHFTFTYTWTSK